MFSSFSTALSALSAHTTAVDVVGNNLANLNTPGYKTSAVSFRDLVTQSIGAGLGETQVGFGTGRPFTTRQFTQGAIQTSTGVLDAAIQGDGFFVTKDAGGGLLFARAGNFKVNQNGVVETMTGERVQGWVEDAAGNVNTNGAIGDIVLPVGTVKPPIASTQMSIDLNLDANAADGTVFSAPIDVVDSLGFSHTVTAKFTKSATPNEWDYSVVIPGADVGSTDAESELLTGTLTFDETGRLTSPAAPPATADPEIAITGLATAAADMTLQWSLYNGVGAPRITQFNQQSAVSANAQNGSPASALTRIGIADGGRLVAQYANGQQRVVGMIALAAIRNPESLIAVGNNNFQASAQTALPAIGVSESGGRGKVIGGAIEHSTVDIAREFTNLIVYQRGYQANSRVVTAVDELSQETINLKR